MKLNKAALSLLVATSLQSAFALRSKQDRKGDKKARAAGAAKHPARLLSKSSSPDDNGDGGEDIIICSNVFGDVRRLGDIGGAITEIVEAGLETAEEIVSEALDDAEGSDSLLELEQVESNGSGKNGGDTLIVKVPILSPCASSCMSGDTGIYRKDSGNNFVVTKLVDLKPGDRVRGYDRKNKLVDNCKVMYVADWGIGPLYGNYTDDHFIYDKEEGYVREHGRIGEKKEMEPKYSLLTTCPFVQDESGIAFTPLDSDIAKYFAGDQRRRLALGDNEVTTTFSLNEYYQLYDATVVLKDLVHPFVPEGAIYTQEALANGLFLSFDPEKAAKYTFKCLLHGNHCDDMRATIMDMVEASFVEEVAVHINTAFPVDTAEMQQYLKERVPPSADKYVSLMSLIGL